MTDDGRQLFAIDAAKDGVRHVVNADDLLAGFLELEASTRAVDLSPPKE